VGVSPTIELQEMSTIASMLERRAWFMEIGEK
jgi:hypothetical protein